MKHSNLYLGLVPPSGGWQSLVVLDTHLKLPRMSNLNLKIGQQRRHIDRPLNTDSEIRGSDPGSA